MVPVCGTYIASLVDVSYHAATIAFSVREAQAIFMHLFGAANCDSIVGFEFVRSHKHSVYVEYLAGFAKNKD